MKLSICVLFLSASLLLANDYYVTVTPSNPYPGQMTEISWGGPHLNTDYWIGICPESQPIAVTKLFGTLGKNGTRTIVFNNPGRYSIRMYYLGMAMSLPAKLEVRLGPDAYSLTASTNVVPVGELLTVNWKTSTNLNITNDRIIFYKTTNTNSYTSIYVAERYSGTVYPLFHSPGEYVIAYIKDNNRSYAVAQLNITVKVPALEKIFSVNSSSSTLSWFAFSNARYEVYSSTNLTPPISWKKVVSAVTGANAWKTYSFPRTSQEQYYWVRDMWD